MGYKRCGECGSYCWLPGRLGGYCPFCAAELLECGRPAPVVEIGAYIRRKGQAAEVVAAAERRLQEKRC